MANNIITGRILVGDTLMISGRYKLDIPSPETTDLNFIRTADIILVQNLR
ncbi:MAG: hypothetical protein U5N85_05175 [Arcicella sp.]|nr:hypothetical protein [Arcicella sp.]